MTIFLFLTIALTAGIAADAAEKPTFESCRVSAVPFNRQWPGHQREIEQTVEARYVRLEANGRERRLDVGDATIPATLLPLSEASRLTAADGRWLLRVDEPADYVVDFGDRAPAVQVFVQPRWRYEPRPNDIYFGPGTHDVGRRVISNSNVRVVLDRGATVIGAFAFVGATNVALVGRGTVDCAKGDLTYGGPFAALRCRNVRLEGVVLKNSRGFNVNVDDCDGVLVDGIKIVGAWRYNSDGIDICASRDTVVRNCYVRSYDDCVVARGCCPWVADAPLRNMIVSNCVLWCDWGKNCEVWAGSRPNVIENVTYRGNRMIRSAGIPMDVTTWFGSSNTVIRNVTFEDQELDLEPRRLKLKMQAYDGEAYVPECQEYCIFGNVDCAGVGAENGNEVDTAVDQDFSKYHLLYSGIRFSDIRVLGARQPLVLRAVVDDRYHELKDFTYDRLPSGTRIQREGPTGNDPVWQTDAVRNLSGSWQRAGETMSKEVMMPTTWTNRTVRLTVEKARGTNLSAFLDGRPLVRRDGPGGSAAFALPPLTRGGKHVLRLAAPIFATQRSRQSLYGLLGRIELDAPEAPDVRWMRGSKGLSVHWTAGLSAPDGRLATFEEAVDAFDVEAFADRLSRVGAKHLIFTVAHAEQMLPMPNAALDALAPGRTTKRDLFGEILDACARRGIRVIAYYNHGCNNSGDSIRRWEEQCGCPCGVAAGGDMKRFARNICAIVGEISRRYGQRISGWWFDSAYSVDSHGIYVATGGGWHVVAKDGPWTGSEVTFPWEDLVRAAKSGNPVAPVAINAGYTRFQYCDTTDYYAGESETFEQSFSPEPDGRRVDTRWIAVDDANWTFSAQRGFVPLRKSVDELRRYADEHARAGRMVTFNVLIDRSGKLSPELDKLESVFK